jgi:hypothetical protein
MLLLQQYIRWVLITILWLLGDSSLLVMPLIIILPQLSAFAYPNQSIRAHPSAQ